MKTNTKTKKKALSVTQMTMILVSMLKELDYLFCSNEISKKLINDNGEEVIISLETCEDENTIPWEIIYKGKQEFVGFSDKDKFVSDCLYMLTYYNVYDYNKI